MRRHIGLEAGHISEGGGPELEAGLCLGNLMLKQGEIGGGDGDRLLIVEQVGIRHDDALQYRRARIA